MIDDLRRFTYIYQTQSISKAAKRSNITQPAMSQSLKRLENALNTKLIIRTNKEFSVTDDGKSVFQMAEKILGIWDAMKDPKIRKSKNKSFTIGIYDNAAIRMARKTKLLTSKDYSVELIIDSSSKLTNLLSLGMLDICICVLDKKSIENSIFLTKFAEELIPVSSKKYTIPLKEIPFLLYNKSSNTRNYIDDIFYKYNVQPIVMAESTSTTFLKELAIQGKGVALLPRNFVSAELKNRQLIRLNLGVKWTRNIGIFLSKKTDLTESSSLVKDITQALKSTKENL